MTEAARIFHVDDEEAIRIDLEKSLKMRRYGGLQVVLAATSVAEALHYVPDELVNRKVNVAIIDGHLLDGEGIQVAQVIAQSGLSIALFGFSSDRIDWMGLPVQHIIKGTAGYTPLASAINSFLSQRP